MRNQVKANGEWEVSKINRKYSASAELESAEFVCWSIYIYFFSGVVFSV
jgi:hypothetical protein